MRLVVRLGAVVGLVIVVLVPTIASGATLTYRNATSSESTWYSSATSTKTGGYVEANYIDAGNATVTIQTYKFTPPGFYNIHASAQAAWFVNMTHGRVTDFKSRCKWYHGLYNGQLGLLCKYTT